MATRITRTVEPRIADQLMGIGMFLASASISFILLLKGSEWTIEAIVWILVSIGRIVFGFVLVTRSITPLKIETKQG